MIVSLSDPKISIIIPTLNQGKFIEETILSITGQSYKNFEIIIIDGGSTDTTTRIIKKYESQITYWVSEKDQGQSNAINKGLKIASGQIVTWLNSDDYYEQGALETIVKLFESDPGVDIVHGKARFFAAKIKSKIIGLEKEITLSEYLPFMRFPQPSSFFRKEFLSRHFAVNEHLDYAMDFDLVVRAILMGAKIKGTDDLLSHYRLHPGSKSNDQIKFLDEWTIVVYKIFCSLKNGARFAKKLEELGLVKNPLLYKSENYQVDNKIYFTDHEIESIFLQHLNLHYHYNYRHFNYNKCALLSSYLKENYPEFYIKNYYNKYNFRLKFIPRFIFDLIRKPGK